MDGYDWIAFVAASVFEIVRPNICCYASSICSPGGSWGVGVCVCAGTDQSFPVEALAQFLDHVKCLIIVALLRGIIVKEDIFVLHNYIDQIQITWQFRSKTDTTQGPYASLGYIFQK